MENIIAIDLGGTTAKMAIVTPNGAIKHKWSIATDISNEGSYIVPNIIKSIKYKLKELDVELSSVLGIGMGTPGSVDVKEKTVIGAYNLNWASLQEVGEVFSKEFDLPFYIDNDANVAALGEQWVGAGNNEDSVVMVTLGTGVGGGIVIDGELLHGISGTAGEIGHITVEADSIFKCTCGKSGCLEALASATGIRALAKHYLASYEGRTPLLTILEQEGDLDSRDIFDAAQAGDEFALSIVDKFSNYLGLALSHIINIINPSKIILGGGVSMAGEFLRERVENFANKYTFPAAQGKTEIKLAKLGNDAGFLGAARLVVNGQNIGELVNK